MSNFAAFLFLLFISAGNCNAALTQGFYKGKCGSEDVESIVAGIVSSFFKKDNTIAAALLRMQFHDCFVRVRIFLYISPQCIFYFGMNEGVKNDISYLIVFIQFDYLSVIHMSFSYIYVHTCI